MTDREALTDRLQEAILDLDSRQLMAEAQGYSSAEWRRWTAREIAEDLARQVARSEGSGLDALREATEAVVREARDLAGYRSGGLPITPGLDVALRKYDAALAAQEEASDD